MDERTIKFQQISDTIFEDDNAALKLISLFESGKVDFKLATAIDNVIMDANMLRESNGEFLVHFNLLPELFISPQKYTSISIKKYTILI